MFADGSQCLMIWGDPTYEGALSWLTAGAAGINPGRNAAAMVLAFAACEALFHQFFWLVPLGEALIPLPFLYLFYLFAAGKTSYSRAMAMNNPLLIYVVLKILTGLLPDAAFRLVFTNGLMSESMVIWFAVLLIVPEKSHS